MLILLVTFAIIALYQKSLLRKRSAGRKETIAAYGVTVLSFVYGAVCLYRPDWGNANRVIHALFAPIQRLIVQG